MKKEERIRRIIIIISSAVAILGGFLMLTRGNPLDKYIGSVIVTNGSDYFEIEGHKYSYNKAGDETKINDFVPLKEAGTISVIEYDPEDENAGISISYSKDYTGDLNYTVYDTQFNVVAENLTSLNVPGERGKTYYIEISVNWGEINKNTTVKYYFALKIKE